jgi:hypothetical protein
MKKLQFSIDIKAPKEEVWKVLWNDATYKKWTSAFMEGSYVVTDWNEGSSAKFLSPDGNGMFSIIDRKITNEFMSFKHLGIIKNGKEEPDSDESRRLSGAMENYKLQESGGITKLQAEVDVVDLGTGEDYVGIMNKAFPKALEKVKELSEKSKVAAEV